MKAENEPAGTSEPALEEGGDAPMEEVNQEEESTMPKAESDEIGMPNEEPAEDMMVETPSLM